MRISVLQHAVNEGPGEIQNWARERGHTVEIHHLYQGDALPAPHDVELLVVMGGEMNVYQDRDYPWLKAERAIVQAVLESGKPVMGICLGAQFIADALGSRVTQNPAYETGWFAVRFAPEWRRIFSLVPPQVTALHWHGDTFALPAGAIRLGASEACGEQGFVVAGRCLALQFHFETDPPLVREMVEGSSDYSLWPKGPYVQKPEEILAEAAVNCAANRPVLFHLLDTFMESVPGIGN